MFLARRGNFKPLHWEDVEQHGWRVGAVLDTKIFEVKKVSDMSTRIRTCPHAQRMEVRYYIEWFWNFDLPNDDHIRQSYRASWIDCSSFEVIPWEYVIHLAVCRTYEAVRERNTYSDTKQIGSGLRPLPIP